MSENVDPQPASAIIYTGSDKLTDPAWLARNVVNSHGADDTLHNFYCTTYGTNHNLEKYYTPQVRMGKHPESGWTHDPAKQPLRFPPDYTRSQTGDGDDMVSTIYSSCYQRPPLKDVEFVDVYSGGKPTFPDNSIATDVNGTRAKSFGTRNNKEEPKHESVYSAEVSHAPKEWMEEQVAADQPSYCDKQSPYLKENPCHSYFVYPELMKSNIQQKTTVYQQSFPTPKINEHENMLACRKSGDPRYRTQFNGFEGTIWQHEFPNRSRFPPTGEKEVERWKTQYNETHKWDDWRTIEDVMRFRRKVGETPIESSGFVINEPEVSILSPRFHEPKANWKSKAKWPSHPVKTDWTTTYLGSFVGKPVEQRAETGHFRAHIPTHHITKQPCSADDSEQKLLNRSGVGKGHNAARRQIDSEMLGKPAGFDAVHWNRLTENNKMIPPF